MLARDYHQKIKSLREESRYEEALELAKESLNQYKGMDMLKNDYGWCLYHLYLKKEPVSLQEIENFRKALTYIVKNIQTNNIYSPLKLSLMKGLEYSKKVIFDEETVLAYYEKLGNETLSEEERVIEVEGKTIKQPTEKEKWYMHYSKALYAASRYEECLSLCDRGLTEYENFHNQNKEWLIKRKADCMIALGEVATGMGILEEIKQQLNHWSVDSSLGECYQNQENWEQASKHFALAAYIGGIEKGKVSLYKKYAELLAISNPQMAYYHLMLIKRIREEEGWRIKQSLIEEINKFNQMGFDLPEGKNLENKLKNFWYEQMFIGKEALTGTIQSILSKGNAGFICATSGEQYYFRFVDFAGPRKLIKQGETVTFYTEKSFDKTKQKESIKAVGIKLLRRSRA
nr:hypothetical protein [uncultured Niameybacter sp.]